MSVVSDDLSLPAHADRNDAQLRTIPVIGDHLAAIRALCREFGVDRLEVFGSVMTEAFDAARSDVDFLVTYPRGYDLGPLYRRHFNLQRAIATVIHHRVELVESTVLRHPSFAAISGETRSTIYDAAVDFGAGLRAAQSQRSWSCDLTS